VVKTGRRNHQRTRAHFRALSYWSGNSEGDLSCHFKTGDYYKKSGEPTFFPEIPVIFTLDKADQHYHIPLLLSQFGYSTYRGT